MGGAWGTACWPIEGLRDLGCSANQPLVLPLRPGFIPALWNSSTRAMSARAVDKRDGSPFHYAGRDAFGVPVREADAAVGLRALSRCWACRR